MSYKNSLLAICKISNLFSNTLSSDGKYSLLDKDNLTERIQMELSQKQKQKFLICFFIFEIKFKFRTFSKKRLPSELMYFRNHGLPKTWLDQYLKSTVSEHSPKNNILNAPKHCSNLKVTPVTTFINNWEGNCLTKSRCY